MMPVQGDWVFLRGLVRQHKHWEQFPELFAEGFPQARIHLLDLPGNGALCDRPSPLTIREMMEAARRLLKARGVGGPVNLLAISLGGMVALEWMHRHRQEVTSAVIINSSMRDVGTVLDRLQPENYLAILKQANRAVGFTDNDGDGLDHDLAEYFKNSIDKSH